MSTVLSHLDVQRPALRLLERRPPRPQVVVRPLVERETFSAWSLRQFERYCAWGERARHHRMGSWTCRHWTL
jgi:hypothetical protein